VRGWVAKATNGGTKNNEPKTSKNGYNLPPDDLRLPSVSDWTTYKTGKFAGATTHELPNIYSLQK